MTDPLVSIIITLYNRENYITDTIDSILNQTYENWELIIINDCSTDNSLNTVINYKKKHNLSNSKMIIKSINIP